MATQAREWPNKMKSVLDDSFEMIKEVKGELEKITSNQVNNEEDIEAIAAIAISNLTIVLLAFQQAGASTDPILELEQRVRYNAPQQRLAPVRV